MDMGTVRGLLTLALMLAFVAIAIWAFSSRRRKDFEEASRLPLDDERPVRRTDDNDNGEAR